MTADVGSTSDEYVVGGVEVPNVATLHDKHDDPINAGDDGIEGEWGSHVPVLTPYCVASMVMFAVCGSVEGEVNRCDHHQKP